MRKLFSFICGLIFLFGMWVGFLLLMLLMAHSAHAECPERHATTCMEDAECRKAFQSIMQYPAVSGWHYHYSHPRNPQDSPKSGAESLLKRKPRYTLGIKEGNMIFNIQEGE